MVQPETAYLKNESEILKKWHAPKGKLFKFAILEVPDSITPEEAKAKLVTSDKPVYLTAKEIDQYKKYK